MRSMIDSVHSMRMTLAALAVLGLAGCVPVPTELGDDGPVAEGISAKLGDPLPTASADELATFERGKAVMARQFNLGDGLGPAFNLTSCGGCHERPTPGGSAGLYRNFFLAGLRTEGGLFAFLPSQGDAGGVQRVFSYNPAETARPSIPPQANVFAQRNPIPMFGMGLLAELSDVEILSRVDEADEDGDGISGRANFDRGAVGRFGRKAQTVSLEGFIRGPLFNHVGITTTALSDQARSQLPVSAKALQSLIEVESRPFLGKAGPHLQIAITDGQTTDDDGVPDPEMRPEDLFDLVAMTMLLAAPQLEEPTPASNRGRLLFHEANCSTCHVPRLNGPRGPLPVYSDLLLHDMGEGLADGIVMLEARGNEFRTQPLWGVAAVGPYLHDGRAESLDDAILAHDGEAAASRAIFESFDADQRADLIEFLLSLGGRDQYSRGLVPPATPVPDVAQFGGPFRELTQAEQERFVRGRELFDSDFGEDSGVGGQSGADGGARFNGDSCRACHFQPTIGGAGPRDVNVMRHGRMDADGSFTPPTDSPNTILHKQIRVGFSIPAAGADVNVFEHRQTPHTFGLGLIDAISEETILANADPEDSNNDGISGRPHVLSDGRIGRFGWKAQVPSVLEFVRDAMTSEIGLTVPEHEGMTFGESVDNDGVSDPELSIGAVEDVAFFLSMLAGPPRGDVSDADEAAILQGSALFTVTGCAACHVPALPSTLGDVPLFSDLLLHEILPVGSPGIADGDASPREFRTPPLWGLGQTAPYLHDGRADTIDQAVRAHAGEAIRAVVNYLTLPEQDREALLAFLASL